MSDPLRDWAMVSGMSEAQYEALRCDGRAAVLAAAGDRIKHWKRIRPAVRAEMVVPLLIARLPGFDHIH